MGTLNKRKVYKVSKYECPIQILQNIFLTCVSSVGDFVDSERRYLVIFRVQHSNWHGAVFFTLQFF